MLNPVQTENAQPGSSDWVLTNPAINREIEGYASLTSVNRGNTINFFISTSGPYTIDIYRMGWYGGLGARKMTVSPIALTGTLQPIPAPTADGLFECNWSVSHTLSVANDWVSGVYVAKLTQSSSGKQSYIIFVVRDDDRASDCLYQSSVTTYQAYNNWPGVASGGKSLYDHNSPTGRANRVSFNRPYAIDPNPDEPGGHAGPATGLGAGEFFTIQNLQTDIIHSAAFEYNMVRFLEREGFDVTYCTNIDTHVNGQTLRPNKHKAFLSVGHDEYWSLEMRDNVEAARDSGVSLGFFGANIAYWQVRLEPSGIDITKPYRTMICYKYDDVAETIPREPVPSGGPGPTGPGPTGPNPTDSLPVDPVPADAPNANLRMTVKWRDSTILKRPEDALIGVMFDLPLVVPTPDNNIVVINTSNSVFAGTGLKDGDVLPGLLGYEVDRVFNPPAGTVALAHSPAGSGNANMTIYTAQSGAIVFATGSLQWSWGLDDYNSPNLRPSRLSDKAQRITRNVLDRMIPKPNPTILIATASATFVGEDNTTQGNWKVKYGRDGHNVFEDGAKDPDYADILVGGKTGDPWARSTSDVRGLQKAAVGSTDRIAAFRYSETDFTIDINLKDKQSHRVAVYCLDWEVNPGNVRSQRIEVIDAVTNEVLDTQNVAHFTSGRYLVWQLKGHVLINVTHTGIFGSNAVISGLFFGPGAAASDASATFVGEDNTTQGNWKGVYGAKGYNIVDDVANYLFDVEVLPSDETLYPEKTPTGLERWLEKGGDGVTERSFTIWYSETNFTIDINLKDGQEHRVALYVLDWDEDDGRSQKMEVLDAVTNEVLDTQNVARFSSGRYLIWRLKGHVKIKITHKGGVGSNAVFSGLFFD